MRRLVSIGFLILSFGFIAGCGGENAPASSDEMTEDSTSTDQMGTIEDFVEADSLENPDQNQATQGTLVEINMPIGRMVLRLYDDTPKHKENFIKLVKSGYYIGTTFHRVMEGFMIQGGDPNSKDANLEDDGRGGPDYTIPNEASRKYFHKRGALAGAQMPSNPTRASSGSQFYIVHGGEPIPDQTILFELQSQVRNNINKPDFEFSAEAKESYYKTGGAPWLDMMYTVFGELVEGFDVLDKIAQSETQRKTGRMTNRAILDYPPRPDEVRIRSMSILESTPTR